jgi:UDP-glucose 4-epimerase
MRALVTGGAGFIGTHLVRRLSERGDEVVVIDNLRRAASPLPRPGVRFIEGDIRDLAALQQAAEGCDTVFHLAAQSNVLGALQDIDYSFTTNVTGTFKVLQAASEAGARRAVFASSREVYGEQCVVPVPENAPLTARNPYGASKAAGEAYCNAWPALAPLECSVLRLANVYGPGDSGRVIPLWLERAARSEELIVYGGRQVIDFIDVGTAVEAFLRAAEAPATGPINIGSGIGTPILSLAERIRALAGRHVGLIVEPARGAEVARFVASTQRMRSVLGIEPDPDPLHALEALWDGRETTRALLAS